MVVATTAPSARRYLDGARRAPRAGTSWMPAVRRMRIRVSDPTSMRAYATRWTRALLPRFENSRGAIESSKHRSSFKPRLQFCEFNVNQMFRTKSTTYSGFKNNSMVLQGFIAFTLNRVFMTLYRSTWPGHHNILTIDRIALPVTLCPRPLQHR